MLLKQGARLVTGAEDIIQELNLSNKQINKYANKQINRNKSKLSNEELKIINLLMSENLCFDEIVQKSGISTEKVGSVLTLMEVKGVISKNKEGDYGIDS